MIYWLMGQPGAGKTTLGKLLCNYLDNTIQIDGDDIRDIFNNKDYSENGRRNNISKAQDLSLFLNKKGFNVIVSLVSPYKDQREEFKKISNVVEIYLHTTSDRGKNKYHVDNFEIPTDNYIDIDTSVSEEESLNEIIKKIKI